MPAGFPATGFLAVILGVGSTPRFAPLPATLTIGFPAPVPGTPAGYFAVRRTDPARPGAPREIELREAGRSLFRSASYTGPTPGKKALREMRRRIATVADIVLVELSKSLVPTGTLGVSS